MFLGKPSGGVIKRSVSKRRSEPRDSELLAVKHERKRGGEDKDYDEDERLDREFIAVTEKNALGKQREGVDGPVFSR